MRNLVKTRVNNLVRISGLILLSVDLVESNSMIVTQQGQDTDCVLDHRGLVRLAVIRTYF